MIVAQTIVGFALQRAKRWDAEITYQVAIALARQHAKSMEIVALTMAAAVVKEEQHTGLPRHRIGFLCSCPFRPMCSGSRTQPRLQTSRQLGRLESQRSRTRSSFSSSLRGGKKVPQAPCRIGRPFAPPQLAGPWAATKSGHCVPATIAATSLVIVARTMWTHARRVLVPRAVPWGVACVEAVVDALAMRLAKHMTIVVRITTVLAESPRS
mmetsp:Transcript_137370/g.342615  ORF Transcript_137370/g.342615 Transcript_137370/m.342615 type:complete len:211 (-) Transcript_137370:102-734(-)